jgi:hypothetical protein
MEAPADYTIVLKMSPRDYDTYHTRALLKIAINDTIGACDDFMTAQELGSKEEDAYILKYHCQ